MKPLSLITDFVLEQIEAQPSTRRIQLYGALADLARDKAEAVAFRGLAVAEERHAANHHQMLLDLQTIRRAPHA